MASTKMGALNETECTFEFIKVAASQTLTKGELCTVDSSGNAIICPTNYAGATQTYVIDEDITTAAGETSRVARFVKTGPCAVKIDAAVTEGATICHLMQQQDRLRYFRDKLQSNDRICKTY